MATKQRAGGKSKKKYPCRNVGPARNRYWGENRLQVHKVRNLVRCCGMSEEDARRYWREARTRRMR